MHPLLLYSPFGKTDTQVTLDLILAFQIGIREVRSLSPFKLSQIDFPLLLFSHTEVLCQNNCTAAYLGLGLGTPGYGATTRLPLQADGATVTIDNPEFPHDITAITEENQTRFRTFIHLKEGDSSTTDILVSTDTLGPSHHHNHWTWHSWDFDSGDTLPR